MSPCPCMPLGKAVKALAITDVVFYTLIIGMSIILFLVGKFGFLISDESLKEEDRIVLETMFLVLITIGGLIEILLGIVLYRGAKHNNNQGCKRWLLVTAIFAVLSVFHLFKSFISGGLNGALIGVSVARLGYKGYEMFVVYMFMERLGNQSGMVSANL